MPAIRLISAPAVIQGCAEEFAARVIQRSSVTAVRQSEMKNQRAGKSDTAAQPTKTTNKQLAIGPSDNRGGRTSRKIPNAPTTNPSAHFSVAPPKKQARTGNSAMTALLILAGRSLIRGRCWDGSADSDI